MPRALSTAVATAISGQMATYCHLLRISFSASNVYVTDAPTAITATVVSSATETATFSCLGGEFTFEPPRESIDLAANGVRVTLSGVDQTVLSLLLSDNCIGRKVYLWRAHFNATTYAVLGTPLLLFSGYANDAWEVEHVPAPDAGGAGTVSLATRFVDATAVLDQVRGICMNLETHQSVYSGDTFFQFVPGLQNKALYWGALSILLGGKMTRVR